MTPSPRSAQCGFTYLWLLFVLAAGAAGLAAIGQRTSVALQRDREAELEFRGSEIVRALDAYRSATPGEPKPLPTSLEDLLDDRRAGRSLRHLRRLYADPFTGRPDWTLERTPDGAVAGLHSRSDVPLLRVVDFPRAQPGRPWRASDRVFQVGLAAAPMPAASAAAEVPIEK